LHVRLDQTAEAALEVVRAGGLNDSEAVRAALREAAARRRARSALEAEAALLSADATDRAEMEAVRNHMAELAPELDE
jgi:hypothetical protein